MGGALFWGGRTPPQGKARRSGVRFTKSEGKLLERALAGPLPSFQATEAATAAERSRAIPKMVSWGLTPKDVGSARAQ